MTNNETEGWIKVKDEKPPIRVHVMFYSTKKDEVFPGYYANDELVTGYFDLLGHGVTLTHWMPYPKSPQKR